MKNFYNIFKSLGTDQNGIYFFFLLILVSAFLEIFGVALVIPVLSLILNTKEIFIIDYSLLNFHFYYEVKRKILINNTIAIVLFFFLFKALFLTFFNYWRSKYIFSLNKKFSKKIFEIYLKLPYLFHLQRNSAVSTRNLISIQNYVKNVDQLAHLITEIVILISFIILLFLYEPKITFFIILVGYLFYLFYNKIVSPINFNIGKTSHKATQDILSSINQGLMGITEIKLYGREKTFFNKFRDVINNFSKSLTTYEFLQPLPRIILEFIAVFLIVTTVIFLIYLNYENDDILIFVALLGAVGFKLIPSLNKIIFANQHLKYYLPLTETILEELKLESKIKKISNKNVIFNNSIEFKNVNFSFENKKVLEQLNFKVFKNQTIGVIGKTGSGKSTLINLFLGLIEPNKGEILIDGIKQNLNSRQWQNKIGFVPQNIYLINDTIRNNIAFGLSEEDIFEEKIDKSLKISQLNEFIITLPKGINTIIDENGSNLSGGQIQRIAIARALYNDPEILIFDEPSSALDNFTEDNLFREIKEISKNKTIIIISHKFSTLEFCDQIYKVENENLSEIKRHND